MYKVDDRGSKDQRILYDYVVSLYSKYEVIYEYPLYDIGQRIDIFIPTLGIAFEFNGRQHTQFVEHFHKDAAGWSKAYKLDEQKINYLKNNGVKLVTINYDEMVDNAEELKQLIENTDYPEAIYSGFDDKSPKKTKELNESRDRRKQTYQERKKQLNNKLD